MNTEAMRDVERAYDDMCWREHEWLAYGHEHHNNCGWENGECSSDNFDGVDLETQHNLWRRVLDAAEVCNKKRDIARKEWETPRRWRYNPTKDGWGYPILDHYEVFEDAAGRTVGIVAHIWHACRQKIEEYAATHKLSATYLEDSWYAPGFATAVLFTKGAT